MSQSAYSDRLRNLVAKFSAARVLVVGDIYLDENVFGAVTGISLEAPIPIFEVHKRRYNPGAAGNAACNVAALGAHTFMVGVVGADMNADIVRREFAARNVDTSGLVVDETRPTNTYGKLKSGGHNIPEQEVLRTDTPTPPFISGAVEEAVIAQIARLAPQVAAIVVTDQVASVVTDRVLAAVAEQARKHGLLTVGDSRGRVGAFRGFDVVVPNDREAGVGAGIDVVDAHTLRAAADRLRKVCKNAVITRGAAGMTVFAEDGSEHTEPTQADRVEDVTGAGDTVTATIAVSLVAGATLHEAAHLASAAAAIAVAQPGVVTVPQAQLLARLDGASSLSNVLPLPELTREVQRLQAEGKKVAWTNGCFDILHAGHIEYLRRAAREGDVLIVGLNSDASVRAIKGPTRPIVPENERALILSQLRFVDYVTVFDDPTPLEILRRLKPDVYTKGGDYTVDTINQEERHVVDAYGGRVAIIPGVEGRSTTNLVARLASEYDE